MKYVISSVFFLWSATADAKIIYNNTIIVKASPGAVVTMEVPQPQVRTNSYPTPRCVWVVDPYDLFGQLFGDPDFVQYCGNGYIPY